MTYKFIRRAIALEYGDNPAPILSAKGEDELAEAIIAEAKKRGVFELVFFRLVPKLFVFFRFLSLFFFVLHQNI